MSVSTAQLLIILLIILLLFGANKLPQIMSDLAKGIKAFKEGISSDDDINKKNN